MTILEAADHFGVHPVTIRRAIHAGRLPAVRVGNGTAYRISRAALEAFIERNTISEAE